MSERAPAAKKTKPLPVGKPVSLAAISHAAALGNQALDAKTQHSMNPRVGHDFSQVRIQALPGAAIAREEDDSGGFLNSLVSDVSGAASSVASGVGSVAKAEWDGTKEMVDLGSKATSFVADPMLQGIKSIDQGVDWMETQSAKGNQQLVDDSKGHWYEGLAQGSAWLNNGITEATGGVVKGVGDIGGGIINGLAHPLDAVAGVEGIMEHNSTVPFLGSTLKAGHGIYDLLDHGGGQYGSSLGDLANHVLNPMQQMRDDSKFDTNLATSIIAPDKNKDGTTDWSAWKDKPMEALARAATNVAPMVAGVGEATLGEGAGEVGSQAARLEAPALEGATGAGTDINAMIDEELAKGGPKPGGQTPLGPDDLSPPNNPSPGFPADTESPNALRDTAKYALGEGATEEEIQKFIDKVNKDFPDEPSNADPYRGQAEKVRIQNSRVRRNKGF